MTKDFKEWVELNSIWMPDNDAMMFDIWNSILKFNHKSRTCENCMYRRISTTTLVASCLNVDSVIFDSVCHLPRDFGCNKFRCKDAD